MQDFVNKISRLGCPFLRQRHGMSSIYPQYSSKVHLSILLQNYNCNLTLPRRYIHHTKFQFSNCLHGHGLLVRGSYGMLVLLKVLHLQHIAEQYWKLEISILMEANHVEWFLYRNVCMCTHTCIYASIRMDNVYIHMWILTIMMMMMSTTNGWFLIT